MSLCENVLVMYLTVEDVEKEMEVEQKKQETEETSDEKKESPSRDVKEEEEPDVEGLDVEGQGHHNAN